MNIYETDEIRPKLLIYKHLSDNIYLTKPMLDTFLHPKVIRYYELCLKARRQNKKYFTINDSDIKMIINQTYLNIIKQIERGQKPIIANKIRELFGMITYNQMSFEIKERVKIKFEYIENIDIIDDDDADEKALFQESNHNLYLSVMEIAQETLTKIELDCFVMKYYSNYKNRQIQSLLQLSNINKVTNILNTAEQKLRQATEHLV